MGPAEASPGGGQDAVIKNCKFRLVACRPYHDDALRALSRLGIAVVPLRPRLDEAPQHGQHWGDLCEIDNGLINARKCGVRIARLINRSDCIAACTRAEF